MLLDLADNKVRTLAPTMQVTALRWGADGRIYVLRQDGGLQQLCSIGTGGGRPRSDA